MTNPIICRRAESKSLTKCLHAITSAAPRTTNETLTLLSQDFKDFVDAENLMPLATSDFRNPICLEMRMLRASEQTISAFGFPEELDAEKKGSNVANGDMTSMDSSDTFASCTTHPFNSQVGIEAGGESAD
ncbi:hypothetical protein NQ318_004782 [Aromia moschata]|uniref:Uncharacterized protein n=1 Tax=Aromia moschata TaxID=1265417 RepID=A0AAV8XRR5_9CUCU|nr:hypothetical protein NQ318_004782 [Aromia moschata]